MIEPEQILKKASSILLVDWPNPGVPSTLIKAGYSTFCYSPKGYTKANIVTEPPKDLEKGQVFPATNPDEEGFLSFTPLNHPPASIDIVCIYRPAPEHERIIHDHVLPLKAGVIWLQPPVESEETKLFALQHHLVFIQGKDIREIRNLTY